MPLSRFHRKIGHLGGKAVPPERRTHWTKGKRRNDPGPEWPALRRQLRALLRPRAFATPGQPSRRGLARRLKVSDRSVRRWLAGEDWPARPSAAQLAAWLRRLERQR